MSSVYDFLFLCQGDLGFLAVTLKGLLDDAGFKTEKCDIDMKQFGKWPELPEIFIVDAQTLIRNKDSRVYLYDLCIERNKKIALIGEADDLKDLSNITSSSVIAEVYERPINNKEVALSLGEKLRSIRDKNNQLRILVVDDSPNFLRLISEWLENDYCVDICPSATAAFQMIGANKPNLILLDYEMPICNGAQFLEMLHSEPDFANIPVIFLTSRGDAATVKEVISLKPQGYLLKTQAKDLILNSIKEFFAKESVK